MSWNSIYEKMTWYIVSWSRNHIHLPTFTFFSAVNNLWIDLMGGLYLNNNYMYWLTEVQDVEIRMVYKITLSGFRAFCTVRTAKTKPINNISILWEKHHLRTLYCDEGHSCCRKGCIPFTTIVLCCFYHVNVNQYFSSSQEYVHVHYSPNYFTCMPLMFNIYPNFFFIYFFVIKKPQNLMTL